MKQSTLKSCDWYLAVMLLALYPVAWMLSKLRRGSRSGIAVVRPGGMGDLICLNIAMEYVTGLSDQNLVYFIDGRSEAWADYRKLSYRRYDVNFFRTLFSSIGRFEKVVVTEQRFASAASYGLLIAGGGALVYGFSTQRLASILDRLTEYSATEEHEVSAFSRLLHESSGDGSRVRPLDEGRLARPRRSRAVLDEFWVCVAGLESPSRSLPVIDFARIVRAYAAGRPVVVACQPSDAEFAQRLVGTLEKATLYAGSFPQLCENLSHAQKVLTVDGGMVHACSFFGVPTIAIFTSGVQEKWRPLGVGSMVIQGGEPDLACRPCARFGQVPPCRNHYACKDFSSIKEPEDE